MEMEQRQYPRVTVPMLVELSHISFGKMTTTVRDISEGGMFIVVDDAKLSPGAQIKVRQLRASSVDLHATPQVDAVVRRVEPHGIGVEYLSVAGAHLWNSVQRTRQELAVGRDYFQVFQSAVLQDERGLVLVVQQQGLWSLPGHFLQVGDVPEEALAAYLFEAFGVRVAVRASLGQTSQHNAKAPEAAIYRTVYHARTADQKATLLPGLGYRSMRWLISAKSTSDLTFADPFDLAMIRRVFAASPGVSAA